jgi:hypothetical protein
LGVERLRIGDDVRQARDSETAHLEAVLKDSGAKALRLMRLRDILQQRGTDALDLQIAPGVECRLWLDLNTSVVMRPDARTYHLSVQGRDRIETVLETESLDAMVTECSRRLAFERLAALRQAPPADSRKRAVSQTTLLYVWMTGVVTGAAVFALCAVLLKKLPF